MAIDKAISYRQQAAFGGIMGRDGRRQYGGGSDMGQVADSSGKTGPGTGGYQGGPKGGYGDAGNKNNPSGDDYARSRREYQQAVNHAAAIEAAKKSKQKENKKNITKFGYAKPKSKIGGILGTIVGMMMGIPGLGLLTGGLGSLKDKLGDTFGNFNETMRGINPVTGKANTQAEYEAMVADRRTQSRIDKMQDRINRGYNQIGFGDFTKTTGPITDNQRATLAGLLGQKDRFGNQFGPSTAQNVLTGRDLKGFTDSRMGLQTIDRPTQTFNFDNSGMTKETDDYTDADFTNEYGYPMTAGLLDNIGVRPTIGMESTPFGSMPTGDVGLNASGRLGNLSATVDAIDALKGESVDPQINYSGNFGNTNVYGNFSDDVQNLGLNFNNDKGLYGGVEYDAITGEPRFDIGFRRTFADGGVASMFTRRG